VIVGGGGDYISLFVAVAVQSGIIMIIFINEAF
jgi:hypothetical protein